MKKSLLLLLILISSISIHSAIIPVSGVKYYILQASTLSGKVIGNTQYNEVELNNATKSSAQLFEFIPVASKTDTYYIKNSDGYYLINSIDLKSLTEYAKDLEGANCEWMLEGSTLASVRLKVASSAYLATNDNLVGSMLYCDKTVADANGVFKLVPENAMSQNYLIDPGFENAVVEGASIGIWVNDKSKIIGNDNVTTLNYRSRIINNGYQCSGSNAFLLRFYGDENSYTKISHKLTGLTKGATYQFAFKYKQSNVITADATVSVYASNTANESAATAISNIFTSTPPPTTTSTQIAQNGIISFIAPAEEFFVVWAKNTESASNFLYYIDDMTLIKTSEAVKQIYTTTTGFTFNATTRSALASITGVLLADSIKINTPAGITVNPKTLAPNAVNSNITVDFTGFSSVSGSITFTSGNTVKEIPVTATFSTSFVMPNSGEKYYLQQRTGGKVIGLKSSGKNAALRFAEKDDASQLMEFIPVIGKANTFNILNGENKYLSASASLLEYTANPTLNSEWLLQGFADTLVYITQATNSAKVIGSDSINNNKTLYSDRLSSAGNSAFSLQKVEVLNTTYIFDPTFENNPADGGPLGSWIPANDPIQLGTFGYSRVQSSAWASSGKKCMYLRFLGDATSYNSISQKLYSLVSGATYRLDLKYKCQSTTTTSLVNIYAATTVNAAKTSAIGGIYTTTVVAQTNLATQTPQSTSLSFIAPASTVYIVYSKNTTATNFNFFIDDLVLTETNPSAIALIKNQLHFNAYFKDNKLYVNFESTNNSNSKIELFNVQGELLFSEKIAWNPQLNQTTLDTNLSQGMYLVKLSLGDNSVVIKIIK